MCCLNVLLATFELHRDIPLDTGDASFAATIQKRKTEIKQKEIASNLPLLLQVLSKFKLKVQVSSYHELYYPAFMYPALF